MSLDEYRRSVQISDTPFKSLIMAAMAKADDQNLAKLKGAWPMVWEELYNRHHAPSGCLTRREMEDLTKAREEARANEDRSDV